MSDEGMGNALKLGSLAAVLVAGILVWRWAVNPERQVRRHQARLLEALEDKAWSAVNRSFSEQYRDRWGHDKAFLEGFSREVFRQFLELEIRTEEVGLEIAADGMDATVRVKMEMLGRGGPFAEGAVAAVRALREPMEFRWSRRGKSPWAWELTGFEQVELEIPELPVL
jgi:hypothetical protein